MALIDVNWKPGARDLRIFSLLFLVFAAALGAPVFYFKYGFILAAKLLWVAAGVVGFVGLAWPRLVLPVYIVMLALALPIGTMVSAVLLAVIYYLVVTPIGLLARLARYDPMSRRFDPQATTYWIERDPDIEARRYFRQY